MLLAALALAAALAILAFYAVAASTVGSAAEAATFATSAPTERGVLPCGRKVVLTAAYRTKGVFRFEGVANPALKGEQVKIFNRRDELVATGTVAGDGTFWATADARGNDYTWLSRFVAVIGPDSSRWRRLGQAVGLRNREAAAGTISRDGGESLELTRVKVRVTGDEPALVVVGRQVGCSRYDVLERFAVVTGPNGVAEIVLPRPSSGDPYAIYRISTEDDNKISPPIVIKPSV